MKIYFKKSQSTVKPELIDDTTFYEYDEAKLTKFEYAEYLKELEATDVSETIENLKAENKQLSETVDMLTNCILEMSEIIYK